MDYPEHQKLKAISDRSQIVGEFVDWLNAEKGIDLCVFHCKRAFDNYEPTMQPIQKLLAEFFEINLDKLEAEKEAMWAL